MDIEVKRMSPTAVEMLDQLSTGFVKGSVWTIMRLPKISDLLDSIAMHEYQLKKHTSKG
ncbi:MAG: hypothetical protein ACLVJH_01305 [Faecalibacterium prausnitzii]